MGSVGSLYPWTWGDCVPTPLCTYTLTRPQAAFWVERAFLLNLQASRFEAAFRHTCSSDPRSSATPSQTNLKVGLDLSSRPVLLPQPIAERLWFRSRGGGGGRKRVGLARGFGPGWLHTPGADATGEFGFFLSHMSFCHIWSLSATGGAAPAQMGSCQSAVSYIPAQNKQTRLPGWTGGWAESGDIYSSGHIPPLMHVGPQRHKQSP